MSNLLPEKWSEALERVHDKVGHFLNKLSPLKKETQTPERITADIRRLTIKGEKNVVRERKGGDGCLISECRYGSFSRSIQLPYEIDEQTIAADLKHGVLAIRLPKPEKGRQARYRVPVS